MTSLAPKLSDKVALVTGAGRGIGRAIALKLASEGARLVINDIDEQLALQVVSEIGASRAVACAGDVTADDFADRFVGTALSSFGGLDIIVNNAGYTWDNVIQKMSDEQFDAMIDVHLKAPFRILRAALGPIREAVKVESAQNRRVQRKIVNISSLAGTHGNAGQVNYASAKAGIAGMTRSLAKEWGRLNVNVNCVAFGMIETRLTGVVGSGVDPITIGERVLKVGLRQSLLDRVVEMAPLGRAGTVEEAAGAVYLFCIPESDYISGQVVLVSGGFVF